MLRMIITLNGELVYALDFKKLKDITGRGFASCSSKSLCIIPDVIMYCYKSSKTTLSQCVFIDNLKIIDTIKI